MGVQSKTFDEKLVQTKAPVLDKTNNTTVAGAAVDTQGYEAASVILSLGAWGDTTTGGYEFALQESADTVSGNFTDVANADLSYYDTAASTVTGASTTGVFAQPSTVGAFSNDYATDYLGKKRYLRVKYSGIGNQSSGTPLGVSIKLSTPISAPTGANRG